MYQKIAELQSQGKSAVLVTVTNTKGSTPREMGAKMLVTESEFFGSIGGGALEWMALEKAREILNSSDPAKLAVPLCSKAHQCCGGFVELFFDVIQPKPQLLIFGAGHVSQALLEVMAGTSFDCTIIDERAEWISVAQKKKAVISTLNLQTHQVDPIQWIDDFNSWNSENTYCVVMTHDHALDLAIIEKLVTRPMKYLGLIGSETKWQRFSARLLDKGLTFEQVSIVQCPMGLRLGGKAPKEVALSIGSQLVQIQYKYNTAARSSLGIPEKSFSLSI